MIRCKSLFRIAAVMLMIPVFAWTADIVQPLTFGPPALNLSNGYATVSMPEARIIGDAGSPSLPSVGCWFLLPPGDQVDNIKLRREVWQTISGSYRVAPTDAPQKLSDPKRTPTPPNPSIYESNFVFPAQAVSSPQTLLKRGFSLATCLVWPVRWNPETGVLQYLASAELVVTSTPGAEESLSFDRFYRSDDYMRNWISRRVVNPGDLPHYPQRDDIDAEGLYIVCASDLVDDMIDYVHWRQTLGILTYIEDVAVLTNEQEGRDDAEKIRNGIINAYDDLGVDYVLLVGDDEIIPHRGMYGNVNDEPELDLPADIYYSGLDGDWNSNNDELWGEARESDMLSEVFIGRWPVDSRAELSNILNKVMTYTDEPVVDDIEKALMLGEDLGWDVWGGEYMDEIFEGSNEWQYRTVGFPEYFQRTNLYDNERVWDPINNLAPAISDGQHFIHHLGHANSWYALKFDLNQVSANVIRNNGANHGYNVVWSQGCYAGAFDNRSTEAGQYGPDCIAERFSVEIPNGFVAYFANSRYGWGSGGNTNGASQHFHREFVDAMFAEDITVIGQTDQDSKEDSAPWLENPVMRWCYYEITLFGDPLMDMWTRQPVEIEAEYTPVILIGEESFPVNIPGVANATICLSRNNEIISVGHTDGDGFVSLELTEPILPPGPVNLTISAHDHITLRTTVQSVSPDLGFPWVEDVILRDIGEGADGQADAGDFMVLSPVVQNLGHGALTGLRVTATSTDNSITFANNAVSYPDIAGDRQSLPREPLTLQILSNCEDLHFVPVQLAFIDGEGNEWSQEISFLVHAPVFSDHILTVIDTENGNGNGKLDPGEEADLVFSIANSGTGSAHNLRLELVTGSPTIEILQGESSIEVIEPMEMGDFTPLFRVRVAEDCPDPYRSFLYLSMSGELCGIRSYILNLKVGGILCNFDSEEEEFWQHAQLSEDYQDQWHRSDNDNHTYNGSGCIKVGAVNEDEEYASLLNCALYMPTFEVTGPLQLMFWHKINAEASEAHPGYAYDGGFVEISSDGGDWELLTPGIGGEGSYPFLFRRGGSPSPMIQDAPCFSGNYDWEQVVFDLSDYRNSECQVRFRFGSDGSTNGLGWWIDDVELMLPMDMASPENLTGQASKNGVQLQWDTPRPTRDEFEDNLLLGYKIYRNLGTWRCLDTLAYVNRYFDNLLSLPTQRLTYMVSAEYTRGGSMPSNFLDVQWVNGVEEKATTLPDTWEISSVYPNPFNSVTRIDFAVPTLGQVRLSVYDQLGREVSNLFQGEKQPGRYSAVFQAKDLPSGIYFARMETPAGNHSLKVVLVR